MRKMQKTTALTNGYTSKVTNLKMCANNEVGLDEIGVELGPISSREKINEFRGNLITNVAHDLKTPLQSIIGYSEMMLMKENTNIDQDQKKYLNTILSNANRLASMIENYFEYSKLEINEVVPKKTNISLSKIIQELNENYALISAKYGITINFNYEGELPHIHGDYIMIYRVFQNLIDNAIKFTSTHGEINVNLCRHSRHEIEVKISDTGAGIPHDELDSIFNKFKTSKYVNNSIMGQNDGLGLGLAIVKKFLSLHNTRIFITSKLGFGTTFTFFLPIR